MKIEITDEREIRGLYRALTLLQNHILKEYGGSPFVAKLVHEIETSHPDIMDKEIEEFGR